VYDELQSVALQDTRQLADDLADSLTILDARMTALRNAFI
jgi:hypothetical protein